MIKQLTVASRGAIEVLLQKDFSISQIAMQIGVHKSTISREIKSRSTPSGYIAWIAQLDYEANRRKCGRKKKLSNSGTEKYVGVEKLGFGWSPEQIAGRMKMEGRDDRVCHETIYAWLYSDEWAYKKEKLCNTYALEGDECASGAIEGQAETTLHVSFFDHIIYIIAPANSKKRT